MLFVTQKNDPELYPYRRGLHFAFYNALNWQVATGTPSVLFMAYLGADSFETGLVYGWALLLTPVQVFATMLLPRVGFKRLTLAGWGARSWFLLMPLVLTLLAPAEPVPWMIFAMVVAMFFYSLSRSIGAAAITTWLQALVPEGVRGRYWASDQIMAGVAAVGTLVISAVLFAVLPAKWAFFVQYVISISGAYFALRCLRTLPDIERPTVMSLAKIRHDTPQHLFRPGPFRRYLALAILYFVVVTPISPFGAYFLKSTANLSMSAIMGFTMLQYCGTIAGNWFMRSRIDRIGTKPFFRLSFVFFGVIAAGWLHCLQMPGATLWLMPALYLLLGAASGMFSAANVSYLAKILPENDRALPVSLHGALTAFIGGLSPAVWGLFLKQSDGSTAALSPVVFQLFFVATLLGVLALVLMVGRLEERAGHVDPLLQGGWLLRPFRAVTNLINLVELPGRRRDERRDDLPPR
jgi:MFS family permease